MDTVREHVGAVAKRKSTSSVYMREQKKLKIAGQAYKTAKNKDKSARNPPPEAVSCKCRYSCKKLTATHKLDLFTKFYACDEIAQKTYLMGLIEVVDIQRRRNGNYEDPRESRRQATAIYHIPNGREKTLLQLLLKKKKMGSVTYIETRGKFEKPKKYSDEIRKHIINHINSIPRCESHYSRAKMNKEYLSPDLNINRLYHAFKTANPDALLSYKLYSEIFHKHFPNLFFQKPRSDTCRVCDELCCKIKSSKYAADINSNKQMLEIHHRKAERATELLKRDAASSQMPGSTLSTICIDLQQVLFVPTLVHSDMFYKRQLSCYNFCVHLCETSKAMMCMWHEGIAQRGSNEIASCLLYVLNNHDMKKNLIIWSDNCCGQNKNRVMIFMLLYLVSIKLFDTIEHKFLVSGHSFLPCDRDFALIEKRKRACKAFVPEELHSIVESSTHTNKFKVIDMLKHRFLDIQTAADNLINTKSLNISKVCHLRFSADTPGIVQTKKTFSDAEAWETARLLKKGKTIEYLRNTEFREQANVKKISDEKKQNLREMVAYLEDPYKDFYINLCS